MHHHRLALTSLTLAALLGSGLASAPALAAGTRYLPAHVYAPYFETWTKQSVANVARKSGARYLTLAFIQSAGRKGAKACELTWDGERSEPISAARYIREIGWLRQHGGDVIPSFGGYSADQFGTEIADSCTSVAKIAKDYEQVITTYHVTTLDMDVEARALTNYAGIARRSEAIALAQHWAWARGIPLRIQFTLGIEPSGMDKYNLGVLRSAVAHGVVVGSVNLMVFDYYLAHERKALRMGKLAIEAVTNAHRQLGQVFPWLSPAGIWHLEGMTMLPGIDDYPKKTEVTYLGDARAMLRFAQATGMNFLSIWAIQRDNGGCPGAIDSNSCSGISAGTWAFSHLLERFTSG